MLGAASWDLPLSTDLGRLWRASLMLEDAEDGAQTDLEREL